MAPNFQRLGDAGQRVLRAARKTAKAPHFGLDISATLHWQEEAIWHEETKLHPYNQTMTVEVRPATPERWNDLVTVFGRRGDDPSWCWCRLFYCSTCELTASEPKPDNRSALRQEITHAAVAPGLIAYVNDQPLGWTRVGPRSAFPRVNDNRALTKVLTVDPGAWWVTCFAVNNSHRRSGIGSTLLEAAVLFAREHGATVVEGHPVDVTALRAARVGGSSIFTGTMAMFSNAGFTEVGRTFPSRPVMRLLV